MIGEMLTGLSADESAPIELKIDRNSPKTKWIIHNAPSWIDLEVGRIARKWEKAGYDEGHALSYAWVSLCLVGIENFNTAGDRLEVPRTESITTRTGDRAPRIPLEWIVKLFGKRYRILDELSTAIYSYNHLTGAERKNWTWQGELSIPGANGASPANTLPAIASPDGAAGGANAAASDSKPQNPETESSTEGP